MRRLPWVMLVATAGCFGSGDSPRSGDDGSAEATIGPVHCEVARNHECLDFTRVTTARLREWCAAEGLPRAGHCAEASSIGSCRTAEYVRVSYGFASDDPYDGQRFPEQIASDCQQGIIRGVYTSPHAPASWRPASDPKPTPLPAIGRCDGIATGVCVDYTAHPKTAAGDCALQRGTYTERVACPGAGAVARCRRAFTTSVFYGSGGWSARDTDYLCAFTGGLSEALDSSLK